MTLHIDKYFLVWFINHTKKELAKDTLRLVKKENMLRREVFIYEILTN